MSKRKTILYIAASLDGYIAKPDGSMDWLHNVEGDGGDNGYGAFYASIGTIVMGRSTYEEVLTLTDEFPYVGKPTYVLSRTRQPPAPHVQFTDEDVATLIPKLQQISEGDVWIVGGGKLVQTILEKRLLDEMEIAIIPKILGNGIPLFLVGTLPSDWTMVSTQTLGQIVSVRYQSKAN